MFKKARESLSMEEIEKILNNFNIFSNDKYNNEKYLVFPTVCHNRIDEEASYKLYYYDSTKMFKCYTQCSETFDIFDLIKRIYTNNYYSIGMGQAYKIVTGKDIENKNKVKTAINFDYSNFKKIKKEIEKNVDIKYDPIVFNAFSNYRIKEWLNEGIAEKTMDKFNIKYSVSSNQVIIPYYNIDKKLIGIRVRNLDEKKPKYMPLMFEGKNYTFSQSKHLYGVYENQEEIKNTKNVILFEGEKSVLKMYSNDNKIALAVGGSSIHREQIKILYKLGVKNVTIAFDKEFEKNSSILSDNYYKILKKKAEKLKHYFRTSFIYDFNNELSYKDSPIDKGYETFKKLYNKKINL